jgi:hypothetical protein
MKTIKAMIALLTLTGCAAVGPVNTPSGNPEVIIKSTDTSRIKGALVKSYSEAGKEVQATLEQLKADIESRG